MPINRITHDQAVPDSNRPVNNDHRNAGLPVARAVPLAQALPASNRRPAPMLLVLIPAAVVFVLSPVLPSTAWWLGVALLLLCVAAVSRTAADKFGWLTESTHNGTAGRTVTTVQVVSRRVLGLAGCRPWPTTKHLIAYGLAGAAIVSAGTVSQRYRLERERQSVVAVEQEAEQRSKVERANRKVAEICQNARATAASIGGGEMAHQLLELAASTPDATDFSPVAAARPIVASHQAHHQLDRAEEMLDAGSVDEASRFVRAALIVPHLTDTERAKQLELHIRMSTDPDRVRAVLVAVPDDQFDRLRGGGPLPPDLTSDFRVLESSARKLAAAAYIAASEARKVRRVAERKRLEEERLAQDAEQHRRTEAMAAREADKKRREAAEAEEQARRNAAPASGEWDGPAGTSGTGATHIGPRGGHYHYTATGKKSYERRKR